MRFTKANRLAHRWATVLVALPILIVLLTGMMLQWKKQAAWIQPPTQTGSTRSPAIAFDSILAAARSIEQAGINTWEDVDRLDVRPSKGIVKVRSQTRWEIQIDTSTGEVLHAAYRRSDLIESLHDGTFFHERVKLWIFFPAALALTLMWASGIYMFALPYLTKRRRARTQKRPPAQSNDRASPGAVVRSDSD